jgi:putative flippase GtrA
MHDISDLAIGAVFVLISASSRFNTPPTNRSSTTALRYHTASLCYLLLGMALYFGLLCFPPIVEGVSKELGYFYETARSLEKISTAPLIALLLTVLLPKVPLLAEADDWVREHLQKMAAIPHEARRLAADLRKLRYSVSPSLQAQVMQRLAGQGFQADDVRFEESPDLKHVWTKTSALMIQLEEWEGDRKFGGFVARHAVELGDLKRRWNQLAPKIRLLYGIAPGDAGASGDRLVLLVQGELAEQSAELLTGIYNLISRGLLQCGTTNGARIMSLAALGFDLRTMNAKPKLTVDHFMTLSLVILAALLPGITMIYRFTEARIGELLNQALMVSIIYCAAVICAAFPKDHWKFAQRGQHNLRPMSFYLVAGLLATTASLVIRFVFQLMLYHLPNEALLRSRLGLPWSVCAFVAAFMVAWMIDDEPTSRMPPARLRWIEALAGAASLALASPLVVTWLIQVNHRLDPGNKLHMLPPPYTLALASSLSIGFVIGYLVPTWYRQARHKNALATDVELGNEAVAAAA